MRFLLFILFSFFSCFSFSQTGNDSLLHSTPSIIPGQTLPSLPDTTGYKNLLPKIDAKQTISDTKEKLFTQKDSLFAKGDTALRSVKPKARSFLKQQIRSFDPHGTISAGYEYGVLPFVAGDNYPSGGFKSEGNISFLALGVPLELTYYYTNIKNVIGLNNYFRVSYDAERFKEGAAEKLGGKKQLLQDQLGRLQLKQQQTAQKLEYLKYLTPSMPSNLDSSMVGESPGNSSRYALPDSGQSNYQGSANLPDTSKYSPGNYSKPDSSGYDYSKYMRQKDSIMNEVAKYQSEYDSINNAINSTNKEIDQMSNYSDGKSNYSNPYLSKAQQLLSRVKKFEIGLCHPSYSTFLVNNIPLQGINLELGKGNNFFAITYGTTINNLLYNTNTIQGTMQSARNLYNYFDFGKLEAGRKVFSVKGGIGAKDDSHIYVGFLLAKGRTDYLLPTPTDPASSVYSRESNVVLELDAKYKFSDNLNVDAVLGKSSVKEEDMSMDQIKRSVNEIFSNYRSYAFLTRINTGIKKTKTKLTFTTRWVDPYFKSFGVGFLRSDNLRYEIKAEQPITSKIKYTIAYKREEDNLLKLYDYKNTLQSVNNTLSLKLNRHFNLRLIYAPLFRQLKSSTYSVTDRNNISTIILSYIPKAKKVTSQFNGFYSRYLITGDSTNINFENFTYTHQFMFKSGFKTDMNVSWFRNNLHDTLSNNTYLAVLSVGYTSQKLGTFSIGGKAAYKKGMEPQIGYLAKISAKIYKGLYFETEMEKIIIGDYYNSLIIEKIQKFPYYCNARLVFNF